MTGKKRPRPIEWVLKEHTNVAALQYIQLGDAIICRVSAESQFGHKAPIDGIVHYYSNAGDYLRFDFYAFSGKVRCIFSVERASDISPWRCSQYWPAHPDQVKAVRFGPRQLARVPLTQLCPDQTVEFSAEGNTEFTSEGKATIALFGVPGYDTSLTLLWAQAGDVHQVLRGDKVALSRISFVNSV